VLCAVGRGGCFAMSYREMGTGLRAGVDGRLINNEAGDCVDDIRRYKTQVKSIYRSIDRMRKSAFKVGLSEPPRDPRLNSVGGCVRGAALV
jgi:hypothetical protein